MRVGIDLVEIDRFQKIIADNPAFLNRVLTNEEKEGADAASWAGKYAAKEALMKCGFMKTGEWLSVQILNNAHGRPLVYDQFGKEATSIQLSISHTKNYVVAVALYEY